MNDRIKALIEECEAAARREGWVGDWEPVAADLEYVVEELGYKPTRDEWLALPGVGWIGGEHCAD